MTPQHCIYINFFLLNSFPSSQYNFTSLSHSHISLIHTFYLTKTFRSTLYLTHICTNITSYPLSHSHLYQYHILPPISLTCVPISHPTLYLTHMCQ